MGEWGDAGVTRLLDTAVEALLSEQLTTQLLHVAGSPAGELKMIEASV